MSTVPITINGVPLVTGGAVNRQIIGTIARTGGSQTYFQIHAAAFEQAKAHQSPPLHAAPDVDAVGAIRSGLRTAGFVA